MEEQQRNIDEVFRQSLGGYREAPPGAAWQDIASRLDEDNGRPRAGFFLRWPWVALSLLLVVGGAWMVVGLNGDKHRAGSKTAIVNKQTESGAGATIENRALPEQHLAPAENLHNAVDGRKAVRQAQRAVPHASSTISKLETGHTPAIAAAQSQASAATEPAPAAKEVGSTVADIAMTREPVAPLAGIARNRARVLGAAPFNHALPAPKSVDPADAAVVQAPEPQVQQPAISATERWTKPEAEYISPLASIGAKAIMKTWPVAPATTIDITSTPMPAATVYGTPKELSPVASNTTVPQATPVAVPQKVAPIAAPIMLQQPEEQAVAAPGEATAQPAAAQDIHIWKEKERISLAAVAGYEQGSNAPVSDRWSVGARLLFPLSEKISVGVQPALRYGKLNTTYLSNAAAYGRSTIQVDSFKTLDASPSVRFSIDTIYNYVVKESFDSIVVLANTAGGTFWELELPLLLHYRPNNSWYIYGGPTLNFGGKLSYQGKGAMNITTITRQDSIAQSQPKSIESFNNYFGRSSLPAYSSFQGSTAADAPDPVRLGYLLGAGYSWRRVFAELSLHQQLTGYKSIAVPLQDAFASPYVRVSIGYLLFGQKPVGKGFGE